MKKYLSIILFVFLSLSGLMLSFTSRVTATGMLVPVDFYGGEGLEIWQEDVEVVIQDFFVLTKVSQIFYNPTGFTQEGMYMFSLPEGAFLTGFATWEGEIKLAGKMLEKERARQIYTREKNLYLDPGLLEQVDANLFETRIFPIPAYGTKRVELEYRQTLTREGGRVFYSYPLLTGGKSQRIKELNLHLTMHSQNKLQTPNFNLPEAKLNKTADGFNLSLNTVNFEAKQDLYITWDLPREAFTAQLAKDKDRGVLLLTLLPEVDERRLPANYHLLLDISGSMMGWPFTMLLDLVSEFLSTLETTDHFNISAFALAGESLWQKPRPALASNLEEARRWLEQLQVKKEGTNLESILRSLEEEPKGTKVIVFTDGQATIGKIASPAILASVPKHLELSLVALGHQVRGQLLKALSGETNNYYLAGEGTAVKEIIKSLLSGLFSQRLQNITLVPRGFPTEVEFLEVPKTVTFGSNLFIFATFKEAAKGSIVLKGSQGGNPKEYELQIDLPQEISANDFLPYHWARAKIDNLLDMLEKADTETTAYKEEWRKEVISLSKEFNIVTPFTSFLAAPRAVLRPRVIKPGDPLLAVSAPKDTVGVTVIFPFGETVSTVFNEDTGMWECRFLVPKDWSDGTYLATIIIDSFNGSQTITNQSFVIDNEPPEVKGQLKPAAVKAGEQVEIWADASADTIILTASLPWGEEADLRWDSSIFYSRGFFQVPKHLAPGKYKIKIIATDQAFNMNSTEVSLDVLPEGGKIDG